MKTTKKKQLDRSEWDRAAMALSTRAEEIENATEAFADTVFVDALKAKQNQIVFGRRGTGKTHLLKRLEEEQISNFQQYRSVPIFVNGSELRHNANVIVEVAPVIALSLYTEFIKALTSKLHEFINSRLDLSVWEKIFGGKHTQTGQRAQAIAKELRDLLQKGEVRFLPAGEASDEIQTLNETVTKVSGGISLNLSDPRSLGWKVDVGASGSKDAKQSGIAFRKIKGQVILPFSQVSARIQELLDLLDGASLMVLFDEWSDIDQSLETQPYLADMMKRTLSSITQMHVKLACIPIRTLLATPISAEHPIPIGYEEADDISADIDLDSIVCIENDFKQFLPFFMTLLKKHMGASLDWVRSMEMSKFEKFVCNEVFAGSDVFSELCQASAGVPRDFLTLFRLATSTQVNQATPKIGLSHIRDGAGKLFESKKRSFKPGSTELSLLDKVYRSIVAKHKTYFFLLEENRSSHPAVEMLWAERLIHRMPAWYYDADAHVRYIYYQIDYGKCVDLLSAEAAKAGEEKGQTMATAIRAFTAKTWIGNFITGVVDSLPQVMAFAEKRQALANEPAGNLAPNPRDIIVEDAILK